MVKKWTPEQFWEYVEGLAGDFNAGQMRDMLAERGLSLAAPPLMEPVGDDDEENELVWRLEHPAWSHSLTGPVQLDKETAVADMRLAAAEIKRLQPYEVELRRIAEDLGESNDPFAAWETLAGRLRTTARTASAEPATYPLNGDQLLREFVSQFGSGAQGCNMDFDAVRELCDAIKARLATPPSDAAREALVQAQKAILTLPLDALGYGEDEAGRWPLRDELLSNIHAALSAAPVSALPDTLSKIQYALTKDSLCDTEKVASARTIVSAAISRNDETSGGVRS